MNEETTLRGAQQAVDQWIKTYGVRYFSELTNMACLTEEVGELAKVIARKYGDQAKKTTLVKKWPTCYGYFAVSLTKQASTLLPNSTKAWKRK